MMLDTDMCMAYKRKGNGNSNASLLASGGECCAWMNSANLFTSGAFKTG